MSDIGWLAYDEREKQQVQDVFRLFLEREARDELGLGEIRDSISDNMFPGVSVLQTKVRYMLFIPWIFRIVENEIKKEVKSKNTVPSPPQIESSVKKHEVELIHSLKNGDVVKDIIGINAEGNLKFFPSDIYWSGLKSWQLYVNEKNAPNVTLNNLYDKIHQQFNQEFHPVADIEDKPEIKKPMWCESLPKAPRNFLKKTNFDLTKQEAEFLREQLCVVHKNTMLAELLKKGGIYNCDYVWDISGKGSLSPGQRKLIRHGEIFSFVMHGASILYNLELSRFPMHNEKIPKYRKMLTKWRKDFEKFYTHKVGTWKLDEFWTVIRHEKHEINANAKKFVEAWHKIIRNNPQNLANSKPAINLIKTRETKMKGKNSRFYEDGTALARWKGDAGINRYNFRWSTVRKHVNDINKAIQQ